MPFDILSTRTIGQFPISVPTSLALESAFNIHPELKHKSVPIKKYDEIWINIRTLFRNLLGSLEGPAAAGIPAESIAHGILDEMSHIEQSVMGDGVRIVFYLSNYKDVELKYRHAVVRRDNTPKQKEYTAVQNKALGLILEAEGPNGRVRLFDLKLHRKQGEQPTKAMIITHYAYDLLSANIFSELVLLESHTGKIKPKGEWYTKLLNGKELSQIPFNELFLQVFGDNETFRPMDIKLRREILEVAKKYNWSPVTTRDKVLYGIGTMQNHFSKELLRSML